MLACWKWDPVERLSFHHLSAIFRGLIEAEELQLPFNGLSVSWKVSNIVT